MEKGTKPIGIKDVAKKAGVSISTVSHVLNETKPVSDSLRKRVMDAVEELHYEVNMVAKGLKSGRTHNIAVVVNSLTSTFFPPLLQSIQGDADRLGYTVTVFATGGDLNKEKQLIQTLKTLWIDGIILSSCADTADPANAPYLEELTSLEINGHPIPLICIESELNTKLDAVIVDDKDGTFRAFNHLYDIGRRNIAYIAGPFAYNTGKLRKEGYLTSLKKYNLPFNSKLVLEGNYTPVSGYECMKAMLSSGETIDGLIAGNDQMAIGAMRAIMDKGLKIPEDIAVVGYDDNFPASLVQMSSINIPKEEMGKMALELLMRRIENPGASRMLISLNGDLVVRNSTIAGTESTWDLENW